MLHEGRAGINEAESEAIDKLVAAHPEDPISFTRRDADESGPLVVTVGSDTHIVNPDGKTRKQAS